jgi:hypothetical protein
MKKIFVDKDEDVAALIEQIISVDDSDLILVIPKNADIGESVSNFHLIKREATSVGKNLLIESVDDGVLALARASGMESIHPLFSRRGVTGRSLSDIVPRRHDQEDDSSELGQLDDESGSKSRSKSRKKPTKKDKDLDIGAEESRSIIDIQIRKSEKKFRGKRVIVAVLIVVIVATVIVFVGGRFFGKATITVNFNETPWNYENKVIASVQIAEVQSNAAIIPGEVFRQTKNTTQPFPASGHDDVSYKATGKIVIYNAYNSDPQQLVATTRFETPDGKIFRLTSAVTVPGAQVKDSKITPSSVTASIVADKAGPGYNVDPMAKLTIPGFKGTPRYEGFYGSIVEPTTGGAIGGKAVPTEEDIKNATVKVQELLKSSVSSKLLTDLPESFKILDPASEVTFGKVTTNKVTDDKGNFSVFGEAQFKAIGFREDDLKVMLLGIVRKTYPNKSFKELDLRYDNIEVDFDKGELTFTLKANGLLWESFSADEFKGKIVGMGAKDAESILKELRDFTDARISLRPFWLTRIPDNPNRIDVVVD